MRVRCDAVREPATIAGMLLLALAENVAAFCAEADELMARVTDSRAK